ncbi:MAG: flavin reductase [Caldilineaceae bacterium]|nr:flavin reductase [Caldilineaceae bacterium]MCB9140001.1 flavin reductase [Caldilineaceae bacterium]
MAVDAQSFKEALAQWASGVTVVTTLHEGEPIGITASSFSSVSAEPPQILICVNKRLFTHRAIEEQGTFAVNILGQEHLEWGKRFAGMIPEIEDRLAGIDAASAVTGCPVFTGALAWLDCRLIHAYDAGSHSVFIGEVLAAAARGEAADPLLYYYRDWRTLTDA